jgi:hypothetical protein
MCLTVAAASGMPARDRLVDTGRERVLDGGLRPQHGLRDLLGRRVASYTSRSR